MPTPKGQPTNTTVKTRRPTKALPAQDLPSPEGMNAAPEKLADIDRQLLQVERGIVQATIEAVRLRGEME